MGARSGEPVAGNPEGSADAFDPRPVDDLLDQVRPRTSPLKKILLAHRDLCTFGSRTDQRVAIGHEHPAGTQSRSRSVDDPDLTASGTLGDLFQRPSSASLRRLMLLATSLDDRTWVP